MSYFDIQFSDGRVGCVGSYIGDLRTVKELLGLGKILYAGRHGELLRNREIIPNGHSFHVSCKVYAFVR